MGSGLGGVGVNKFVAGAVIVVVFATAQHARATDDIMVTKAPTTPYSAASAYDWTGFYVGSHLGYAGGSSHWSATQDGAAAPSLAGTLDFFNMYNAFRGTGSDLLGLQAGYDYMFRSRFLLGAEADVVVSRRPWRQPNDLLRAHRPGELSGASTNVRHGARPHRLRARELALLRNRRLRLELRPIHPHATCGHAGWRHRAIGRGRNVAHVTTGRRGGRRRHRTRAGAELGGTARVSLHRLRIARRHVCGRSPAFRF